jgi:hypothetical protein
MNTAFCHGSCWIAFGLLALIGCGPGVGEGPLPASRPSDGAVLDGAAEAGSDASGKTDASRAADDTMDASLVSSYACVSPEAEAYTLFSASQIGNGVQLVTMGENTLLAEKSVDGVVEPLLVFLDLGSSDARATERGRATLAQKPAASLQPIGVVNRRDGPLGSAWPFSFYALVLVRGQNGNALYGANLPTNGSSELILIADSEIPINARLRGLVYLPDKMVEVESQVTSEARFERLCLFGDGLYCLSYDGAAWNQTTEIEAASGSLFNSVAVWNDGQAWLLIAVGDEGRVAKVSLDDRDTSREISVDTTSNLLTVSVSDTRLAIGGENGTVVYVDRSTDTPKICNLSAQPIVSLKWWGSRLRGIERNGELFEVPFGGCQACAYGISVDSALYGRLIGIGGDFLLLNREAVILVTANLEPIVLN